MRRLNLLSWRAAAVVGVVAVLAGCSQPEPLVREGGYAGSGPVETPLQMPTTAIGDGGITSGSASGASGGAVTSGDASTATEPARTIPVVEPEPGSTWTPPVERADDLKLFESAKQLGYTMEYRDPATFPAKATGLTPPTMDADGFTQTEAGAVLVTNYFFHALDYFVNTGDAASLDAVTTIDCVNCTNVSSEIKSIYGVQGYAANQDISVENLRIVETTESGFILEGDVTFSATDMYFPAASAHMYSPPRNGVWRTEVIWSEKGFFLIQNSQPVEPK